MLPVSYVEAQSTEQLLNALMAKVCQLDQALKEAGLLPMNDWVAERFETSKYYLGGTYVTRNGLLYRARDDVSPGEWNEADWEQITIGDGLENADNAYYLALSKQTRRLERQITLDHNSWINHELTVFVEGVTADSLVQVAPEPGSDLEEWADNDLQVVAQATDTLTFTNETNPLVDVTVNVVIWR